MILIRYKTTKFKEKYFIRLPAKWLREFGYHTGDLVDIIYSKHEIRIQKTNELTKNNKRRINRDNQVLIPKEIINSANIEVGKEYMEYIDLEGRGFIIKF